MYNEFNFDNDFSVGYRILNKRDIGTWTLIGGGGGASSTIINSGNGQGGGSGGGLPSSGNISLSQIQNVLGGSNPISLSEYYSAASGIPASGAIDVSDFYGAGGVETSGLSLFLDPGNSSSYSGSGTTWTDLSNASNNGTLTSTGITHSSTTNGGIFSITNPGHISFGTNVTNISQVGRGFTFQVFIKPNIISSYMGIFGAYSSTSDGRCYNWLRITGSRLRWFTTNSVGGYQQILGPYLTNNAWVHITILVTSVTFGTRQGQCKFYINGSLDSTHNLDIQDSAASGVDIRIGKNSFFSSTPYNGQYYGDIGVVLWYSRELTATEISSNYNLFKSRYGLT